MSYLKSPLVGLALACSLLAACNDDGAPVPTPHSLKFVQTWGSATGYATTTATVPYFPSVASQTTGIAVPGVAVAPAITPPANTSTTAAVFANATIRQTFRVSVGGPTMRLRLSNAYSTADLVIDETHVALFDKAACQPPPVPVAPATAANGTTCTNIVAASDRTVTVNGNKTFTIPRGQEIYTDPVALAVAPQGDVTVSFYVRNATPALTTHLTGQQTSYYAVGVAGSTANYTGATAFNASTLNGQAALATSTTVVVATGIDVMAPTPTRTIVAFGDSITDGYNTVNDTSTRWPDRLSARFQAQSQLDGKLPVAVSNAGISGNKVASDNATSFFGVAGTTRFQQDVLSRSGVTDVIVLEGINDIGQSATPSATIITAYRELIRQAHARGVKIYFATITPIRSDRSADAGIYPGTYDPSAALFASREAIRLDVNTWIVSSGAEFDGIIDFNAAVAPMGRPNLLAAANNVSLTLGTYDDLHPNATGLQLMANTVALTLFR